MKHWYFTLLLFFCLNSYAQYKYKFIVDKSGNGDYTTVQGAIDACRSFPDKRITIFIKNGEYYEKIKISECNPLISLIGENKEHTIIWFDDYFNKMNRGRNSTFYTSTLNIEANDITLENLTIENRAGRVGQAVALHITGDRCVVKNCILLGNQDTLYAAGENSRQYYTKCYIEGTIDFIFGSATALFDECEIKNKSNSFITASNAKQNQKYGFVFNKCQLTASENVDTVYLGRPWRDYAKAVYLNCTMGNHITPLGWHNWSSPKREKTAFFGEYNNRGEGATTKDRVSWSKQLTKEESLSYSADSVFNTTIFFKDDNANWFKKE